MGKADCCCALPAGPTRVSFLGRRESNFEIVNQKCVFADGGGGGGVFIDNCREVKVRADRLALPPSCPVGNAAYFLC